MAWFRLDDQFHSQPKVIEAGNAAIGLYCRLGTYSADKLTDGFIAESIARSMGTPKELKALTHCAIPDTRELLTKVAGGYLMRDYLLYNPSKEQVLAERAAAKARMDRLRGRSAVCSGEQTANEQANIARSSAPPLPHTPIVNSFSNNSHPLTLVGGGDNFRIRRDEVAAEYARLAVEQAGAKGRPVTNRESYTRQAMQTAIKNPDLKLYLERFPTAPANAVACWLHGDKHSMRQYAQ